MLGRGGRDGKREGERESEREREREREREGESNILMMGAMHPVCVFEQIRYHGDKAQHSRTHSLSLLPFHL